MATTPLINDIQTVPQSWPGAFGVYKHSKTVVSTNLWVIVLLFVFSFALSSASSIADEKSTAYMSISLITSLASLWFQASMVMAFLSGIRAKRVSINDALQTGGTFFVKFLLQSLLMGLIAIVSFLLLIVPAFIILPRLALAQYYLLDKNMGVVDSLKASWEATRGHVGKVWGIFGVNILIGLLFITFIGIPFAAYFGLMYSAAIAILYVWLEKHGEKFPPKAKTEVPAGPIIASK